MTYKEKVRWLRRYQECLHREQELADELKQFRAHAYKITSSLTGMPKAGNDGQSLSRGVEKIVQVQNDLQTQIERCFSIRQEIITVLEQIPDQRDQEILRRRYMMNEKWEQIASDVNYCCRQVHRRHRVCVEALNLPETDKNVQQCPL